MSSRLPHSPHSPHPLRSPYSQSPAPPGSGTARLLGIILSLGCIVFVLLNAILPFGDHRVSALIFSVLIGLFGVRVFILWFKVDRANTFAATVQSMHDMQQRPYGSTSQTGQMQQPSPLPRMTQFSQPLPMLPTTHSALTMAMNTGMPTSSIPSGPLAEPQFSQAYMPSSTSAAPSSYGAQPFSNRAEEMRPPNPMIPYVPIDQDPLFQLDEPGGDEHFFILPKEGEPMVECQDRLALHSQARRYAVSDGVAGSFVPGPWARIVARNFVAHEGVFANPQNFQQWLAACSEEWHAWIEHRWVPTMNALREHSGDRAGDWSNDIRQGAQTTLIGCTLHPSEVNTSTRITVYAIGDSQFFLFSPDMEGGWKLSQAFPFTSPTEFNARPQTLLTVMRPDLVEREWTQVKTTFVDGLPGDYLILATDTMAKWLLTQVQQRNQDWMALLINTHPTYFEQCMRQELHANRLEDDDLTLLIIPIS